jgi:hypothetical protein
MEQKNFHLSQLDQPMRRSKHFSKSIMTSILLIFFGFSFVGCDESGNTVIQPGNEQPTAEETAEYERELAEMQEER